MPKTEDRIKALADYLEVEPDTIKVAYDYTDNLFETEDGEEYLVVTEEEAYEAAKDDIINFIDDLGIGGFTPGFQDWILENAVDTDFLYDYAREDYDNYVYDIEDEPDDEYGTRLAAECVENGLVSEEDFEDGEYVGDEDLGELLVTYLVDQVDDYREWFVSNFGKDELNRVLQDANLDYDAIVDECISWDGIAHFIARYDGEEIELENDLFAYRQN